MQFNCFPNSPKQNTNAVFCDQLHVRKRDHKSLMDTSVVLRVNLWKLRAQSYKSELRAMGASEGSPTWTVSPPYHSDAIPYTCFPSSSFLDTSNSLSTIPSLPMPLNGQVRSFHKLTHGTTPISTKYSRSRAPT